MENRKIIQVEEKVPAKLLIPLSIQHMFATVSYTHLDVYKRQKLLIMIIKRLESRELMSLTMMVLE